MKIGSLKPGDVVWDVCRRKMGNTTAPMVVIYEVRICFVETSIMDTVIITASWNGNPARRYRERDARRWRRQKPVLIRSAMGRARLATRDEVKAMKASM